MMSNNARLVQFVAGTFGGTLFSIIGFLMFMNYGGQRGCWAFIELITKQVGYEACGQAGLLFTGIAAIMSAFVTTAMHAIQRIRLRMNRKAELA
ncbi:MAG: hypothetical protein COU35_03200 [Candidatus Magasanikbacteria bacterium CG10_big_fil_rev_8_21_14_0_10_47_10]|uniref:Uncharacterized protein n=1 Tax=Candidatus Magasanikbacteria bacterium CG10_big_fil_rev_8_21_14_0_10_47_10 TaxID=1974652 RepID=A0A2H0TQ30_9BACT|nr:MAG: hypothetical protein COU35_03200 [Candidatus Magasanikbacteria bacterium CG10_big_fil_rev_8_21_14_0_10_47_10]